MSRVSISENFIAICFFQVVNIFNLFITYGDTFLPSPTSYDELYYEIIRVHQIFDNLYSMGESDKLVCCSLDKTLFARSMSACKE